MKIDILTLQGSLTGVIPFDIESPGVGGSELMVLQWARHMALRGYDISIYNDARIPGTYDGVHFKNYQEFKNEEERDVLISFRTPQPEETIPAKARIRLGWSTDQFDAAYQKQWYALVDGIVGISEYQKQDHMKRCGLSDAENKMKIIEIGSEASEYPWVTKKPYQFIYNSIPGRGLQYLAELWPAIRILLPEATLIITSDYRLWTQGQFAGNEDFRELFKNMPGVRFLGSIPRSELVRHELESEIHLYPCVYEELFCISSAEAQMAGCYEITSSIAALETTNFTGYKSRYTPGTPAFALDAMSELRRFYSLSEVERNQIHLSIRDKAHTRFDWNRICDEWEKYLKNFHKK